MNWLTAIAEALSAIFNFGTKVVPSDVIREDNHQIRKPRLEQREKIRIYDVAFRRLKNHTEIDIATDVKFNYDNLDEEDQKELIDLLTKRIIEHRKKHPVLFRKWLRQNNLI